MYVHISRDIWQALDFITDNFECEIATRTDWKGLNDRIYIRIFVPKTDGADFAGTILAEFQIRFNAVQELIDGKPYIVNMKNYIAYYYTIQSERIKL